MYDKRALATRPACGLCGSADIVCDHPSTGTCPAPAEGPTRAQERAIDRMIALHGRGVLEMQHDGSAVITGVLDDIERERFCLEPDGTERWRDF